MNIAHVTLLTNVTDFGVVKKHQRTRFENIGSKWRSFQDNPGTHVLIINKVSQVSDDQRICDLDLRLNRAAIRDNLHAV